VEKNTGDIFRMKTLEFYNTYHLGDCLFHIHYCNKLIQVNDCKIIFYCKKEYHNELELWITDKDKIILEDLNKKSNLSINCWLNSMKHFDLRGQYDFFYDKIYLAFYRDLSKKIDGIINPIGTSKDFLFDERQIIENKNVNIFSKFDYLIINSKGNSGQWNYNENDFNLLFQKLIDKECTVITTAKNNYKLPCTLDYNWNLLDISTVSLYCKNIFGIHTAPHIPCLNIWNIKDQKEMSFLHNEGIYYSYENHINIKSLKELYDIDF